MRKKYSNNRPKAVKRLVPCLASLNVVLAERNAYTIKGGKRASKLTQRKRRRVLEKMFRDLHAGLFIIDSVHKLRTKHVNYLFTKWVEEDMSAGSILNNISILNVFCDWINKPGMKNDFNRGLIPKEKLSRSMKTKVDKDWSKDDDFEEIMEKILKHDSAVYTQLLLMYAFGLRVNEASQLRVIIADHGNSLDVHWGTKGGLRRNVIIEHQYQREILDYAIASLEPGQHIYSTIPKGYSLKQWIRHFYHIISTNGITRKNGKASHGLRHGYAHRMLEEQSGYLAPILSGEKLPKTDEAIIAKLKVSHSLGHGRAQIVDAYIG